MIYFLIPFRAKTTTKNWDIVCELLNETVSSIRNSTSDCYKIVIIGHDPPNINLNKAKEIFIQADFDPPPEKAQYWSDEKRIFSWHTDKGKKLLTGIQYARQNNSTYFMPLDGDDLISCKLVEYCLTEKHTNGYFLQSGYRTDPKFQNYLFVRHKKFYEECGSSCILNTRKAPFPPVDLDFKLEDFSNYFVRRYVTHAYIPDCMGRQNTPLAPIPFPGAIYRFNSQNIYANSIRGKSGMLRDLGRLILKGRRLSKELKQEFSIP